MNTRKCKLKREEKPKYFMQISRHTLFKIYYIDYFETAEVSFLNVVCNQRSMPCKIGKASFYEWGASRRDGITKVHISAKSDSGGNESQLEKKQERNLLGEKHW